MSTGTTPTEQPTVKRTRKPRATGPALDLGSLAIDSAPAPTRSGHGRSSRFEKPEDNPFYKALQESMRVKTPMGNGNWRGEGKRVVVLTSQVPEVTNLIQYAANALNCGRAIQVKPVGKAQGDNAKSEVRFCAQSKRNRQKKSA